MTLSLEWFKGYDERNRQRDIDGVSVESAEAALGLYYSSVGPVAKEMAEWLYKNWTLEKLFTLSNMSRQILMNIVEEDLVKLQSKAK